jgi:hypothetical protein
MSTSMDSAASSGISFRYSGLERPKIRGTVNLYSISKLGNLGLYLQFDSQGSNYRSTEWIVPIPNTRSSTYATVLK